MRYRISLFIIILCILLISACSYNIPGSLFATKTPLPSATPTATLTPTNTPLPTATPTPPPAIRILSGDQAYKDGDFDSALEAYQLAADITSDPDIKAAAFTKIGRIYYQQKQVQKALDTLRQVTENYTSPDSLSMAYVYLAEIYTFLQRPAESAAAYQSYLDLKPGILDSYFP